MPTFEAACWQDPRFLTLTDAEGRITDRVDPPPNPLRRADQEVLRYVRTRDAAVSLHLALPSEVTDLNNHIVVTKAELKGRAVSDRRRRNAR